MKLSQILLGNSLQTATSLGRQLAELQSQIHQKQLCMVKNIAQYLVYQRGEFSPRLFSGPSSTGNKEGYAPQQMLLTTVENRMLI